MEFHSKLRQLRKAQQMSQEELANQLNVSRQAVSKWESGQGFPETDTLLAICNLFGVSLDYLLKDTQDGEAREQEAGYYVSREMAHGYLEMKKQGAKYIAAGVAVMVVSLSFTTLFEDALGTFLFFRCIAAGVAILVLQGVRPKRYAELEKQPLVFDEGFLREFRNRSVSERKRYGICMAAGVITVILSYPVNILVEDILRLPSQYEAVYPILWAFGIAMILVNGSALISVDVIEKNAEHMAELHNERKVSWIYGIGFLLAASVFLAVGILADKWTPGWVVFPIAALLCTAVSLAVNSKNTKN